LLASIRGRANKTAIIKHLDTGETFRRSAERRAEKMPAFPTKSFLVFNELESPDIFFV
jgi:hypothetical protein